jgi:hypothetical protein
VGRGRLLLMDSLRAGELGRFTDLVEQRSHRVPLQHLLGTAAYRHLELAVGDGVFVPRPETELLAGWGRALEEAGAPVPEWLVGTWSARSGYELGRRLVKDAAVTAVFCANDNMALGVLRAVAEAGHQVPADVSEAIWQSGLDEWLGALRDIAQRYLGGDATVQPSPDACRNCHLTVLCRRVELAENEIVAAELADE